MTHLGPLLAMLLALATAAPKALAGGGELENGGVIILLHAEYSYYSGEGVCMTFIIIADDDEVRELNDRLVSEEDVRYVHLDQSRVNLRLRPVSDQVLAGHIVSTGQNVMVVTSSYAAAHHM